MEADAQRGSGLGEEERLAARRPPGKSRGPAGGFVYKRKQNNKGEEVGGIVPHVTLRSIANNEPPTEEVLVDRPEVTKGITRVTGPFVFEATTPTAMDTEHAASEHAASEHAASEHAASEHAASEHAAQASAKPVVKRL